MDQLSQSALPTFVSRPHFFFRFLVPASANEACTRQRWYIDRDRPSTTAKTDLDGSQTQCHQHADMAMSVTDGKRSPPSTAEWYVTCPTGECCAVTMMCAACCAARLSTVLRRQHVDLRCSCIRVLIAWTMPSCFTIIDAGDFPFVAMTLTFSISCNTVVSYKCTPPYIYHG